MTQAALHQGETLRAPASGMNYGYVTHCQSSSPRSSCITAISTSRSCCSRSSLARGLVLNARSALEPETQHGAGIQTYLPAGASRTCLAQSVMELHRDTLGTRWWPFQRKLEGNSLFYLESQRGRESRTRVPVFQGPES